MFLLRTQGSPLRVQPWAELHNAFGVESRSEAAGITQPPSATHRRGTSREVCVNRSRIVARDQGSGSRLTANMRLARFWTE